MIHIEAREKTTKGNFDDLKSADLISSELVSIILNVPLQSIKFFPGAYITPECP